MSADLNAPPKDVVQDEWYRFKSDISVSLSGGTVAMSFDSGHARRLVMCLDAKEAKGFVSFLKKFATLAEAFVPSEKPKAVLDSPMTPPPAPTPAVPPAASAAPPSIFD
jgi:hypothetical protein